MNVNDDGPAFDPREGDFVWSTNEEEFTNQDFGELLDSLDNDGELVAGRIVYFGERLTRDAASFMPSADYLLEIAGESAYDFGGEWAEDFGDDASAEAKKELEALLGEWANKHLAVHFYQVQHTRQYTLTAEDVARGAQ